MSTIRTVTLSPGFDHMVRLDALTPGATSRVLSWRAEPAGKGVNVARALRYLDADATAYALVGDGEHGAFGAALAADGIAHVLVGVPQATRNNLTLSIDGDGAMASHATGPRMRDVPGALIDALFGQLAEDVVAGDIVCFNGSLPTGANPATWANWSGVLRRKGATLVADVQGEALAGVIQGGGLQAVKPNEDEMQAIPGIPAAGDPLQRARVAVALLQAAGVADPMVTLGARGVVHLVDGKPRLSCCRVDRPRVAVGAGDAFLAGYCMTLMGRERGAQPVLAGLAVAAAHVGGAMRDTLAPAARAASARITSEPL